MQDHGGNEVSSPFMKRLPKEVMHVILCDFLNLPSLLALGITSKNFLTLIDHPAIWKHQAAGRISHREGPATFGPFHAFLQEGKADTPWVVETSRHSQLAFERQRARFLRTMLAPLQLGPVLQVSDYFVAHDAIVGCGAYDLMEDVISTLLSTATNSISLEVMVSLHALYTLHRKGGVASSYGQWWKGRLAELARGPFRGSIVVAYWTMGEHNPYGFRPRDVLRKSTMDAREVASAMLEGEGGGKGEEVPAIWARMCSLRSIVPVTFLDPAVVYVQMEE